MNRCDLHILKAPHLLLEALDRRSPPSGNPSLTASTPASPQGTLLPCLSPGRILITHAQAWGPASRTRVKPALPWVQSGPLSPALPLLSSRQPWRTGSTGPFSGTPRPGSRSPGSNHTGGWALGRRPLQGTFASVAQGSGKEGQPCVLSASVNKRHLSRAEVLGHHD